MVSESHIRKRAERAFHLVERALLRTLFAGETQLSSFHSSRRTAGRKGRARSARRLRTPVVFLRDGLAPEPTLRRRLNELHEFQYLCFQLVSYISVNLQRLANWIRHEPVQ